SRRPNRTRCNRSRCGCRFPCPGRSPPARRPPRRRAPAARSAGSRATRRAPRTSLRYRPSPCRTRVARRTCSPASSWTGSRHLFFLRAMPSSLHLPRPLENTGELVDHLVALGIRQPENDLQCDRYVRDIFLDVTRLLFLVGGAIATADMAIQAAAALLQRQLQ